MCIYSFVMQIATIKLTMLSVIKLSVVASATVHARVNGTFQHDRSIFWS
jgi:hypothetical protein